MESVIVFYLVDPPTPPPKYNKMLSFPFSLMCYIDVST